MIHFNVWQNPLQYKKLKKLKKKNAKKKKRTFQRSIYLDWLEKNYKAWVFSQIFKVVVKFRESKTNVVRHYNCETQKEIESIFWALNI